MSQQDEAFLKNPNRMKISTVGALALLLISPLSYAASDTSEPSEQFKREAIIERLKPIGEVRVGAVVEEAAPAAEEGPVDGPSVYSATCVVCHGAGIAGAPKVGDAEQWTARIEQGKETLYTHAIAGFQGSAGVMPPKGGNMQLSDDAVKAAVDYMIAEVTGEAAPAAEEAAPAAEEAAAPAAEEAAPAEEEAAAPAAEEAAPAAEEAAAPAAEEAGADLAQGEAVYNQACFVCHAQGIAGAPKLGDAALWGPRIEKGMETLVNHAVNGFQGETGIMPPKGGQMQLSDDEVKNAVAYMVSAAQ